MFVFGAVWSGWDSNRPWWSYCFRVCRVKSKVTCGFRANFAAGHKQGGVWTVEKKKPLQWQAITALNMTELDVPLQRTRGCVRLHIITYEICQRNDLCVCASWPYQGVCIGPLIIYTRLFALCACVCFHNLLGVLEVDSAADPACIWIRFDWKKGKIWARGKNSNSRFTPRTTYY